MTKNKVRKPALRVGTVGIAAALAVALVCGVVLMGCATYEETEAKKANEKVDERAAIERGDEEVYKKAVAREPDNPEPNYDRGWYYYAYSSRNREDFIAAAKEWGMALEKDPDYAMKNGLTLPTQIAAEKGLTNLTKPLDLSGVHLDYLIGAAYLETVIYGKVPEAEYDEYLEKALAHFQKGYDHDITGEKHNTTDAKTAYLITIGHARNLKGDYDGAIAAYRELYQELVATQDIYYGKSGIASRIRELEGKKRTVAAYQALAAKGMYYVSASGSNDNDGLSEETAFKTLSKALSATWRSDIKAITVIGTLNQESEGDDDDEVFSISSLFSDTSILITGIPYAPRARRAVLSAQGTDKGCVHAYDSFRFEHIEISGSPQAGLAISVDGEVTLGEEARITGNDDGGVLVYGIKEGLRGGSVKSGHLILDGGIIENNKTETNGAGVLVNGMFTMKRGSIANNTVTGTNYSGGGVFINSNDPVTIAGGTISGNKAPYSAGVYVYAGSLTQSGGSISANEASLGGGGVVVDDDASFILDGGTISYNKSSSNGAGVAVMGGTFTVKRGSIRNNTVTGTGHLGGGMFIGSDGTASIEGGDISGNKASHGAGVSVSGGSLTQSGGSISANVANTGGGVKVDEHGTFVQSGGSITKNTAVHTGGVYVEKGSTFTQKGGSVSGNTAPQGSPDIYRAK